MGMHAWIPVRGTTKGRLVVQALAEFGSRGYDEVSVGELAAAAGVTTGSLYHHFTSKLGLYSLVRADVERRVLDRMEGATAVRAALPEVMLVGFDYLVGAGYARLLSEPHPGSLIDPIDVFIKTLADSDELANLLLAAWRAALDAAAHGTQAAAKVRAALLRLLTGGVID